MVVILRQALVQAICVLSIFTAGRHFVSSFTSLNVRKNLLFRSGANAVTQKVPDDFFPLFGQRSNQDESYSSAEIQVEEDTWLSLTKKALKIDSSSETLKTVKLRGVAELPTTSYASNRLCLVFGLDENDDDASSMNPRPCLLVPLIRDFYLKPIEAAYAGKPLSEPSLLRSNSNLINRDGGLWDNLPWSSWTVDLIQRNRDAAGNSIDPKFHLGKRDAYNVMLGKDWFTYRTPSRAVSSLAEQLRDAVNRKPLLSQQSKEEPNSHESRNDDDKYEEKNQKSLARRLLEFQIREIEMEIAELDYQLAIARLQNPDEVVALEFQKEEILVGLEVLNDQMEELALDVKQQTQADQNGDMSDLMGRILQSIDKRQAAPYRGATGYAPYQGDGGERTLDQFTSSYSMLVDIIGNQLNADVIGCVLENTSLLEGTIVVGGAVVLRRRTAKKDVSIMGQTFSVQDEDEEFGNKGVQGGETFVVECEADEALGLSLVCPNVPLQVESELWEPCAIIAERAKPADETTKQLSDTLETCRVLNSELSVLLEGQARNESATERVAPVRVPRTATSLFDTMIAQLSQPPDQDKNTTLFPVDNPVRSLSQLDKMTDQDKALTLMSMSNFEGRLPRPRTVRQAKKEAREDPLNELLLPRIDESVRRQYMIREATDRGDMDLVRELEQAKSPRQRAQEAAEKARFMGEDDAADQWDQEAAFLESLRADVTQDVGSYSRFLDRDEWYERERRKTAQRANKKMFGTLLDGIE